MTRWIRRLFERLKGRRAGVSRPRVAWNGRPLAAEEAGAPDYSTLTLRPAQRPRTQARSEHD
jgi:hypothetical protein